MSAQGCSSQREQDVRRSIEQPGSWGTKKAAILESEVKGEQSDQAGEGLRSQMMGNYTRAFGEAGDSQWWDWARM